ncbi:GIY-YIG nuclease family protein [Carboxylicivirga sediminis]|uniref:GIY-YIG nuclease family protein n=1 Tax=Carboxylicivirga sediminis TaxID=2006564 RepID=A0A941F145_9BACT|nr:GIY-YIG nuclease family protein [Carboxylicivirga sediminis]
MYHVYVLYSKRYNKIYIGYTSDLKKRLLSHNERSNKGYTVKYRPWNLLYTESFEDKAETLRREKQLKGGQGREFIWDMVNKK